MMDGTSNEQRDAEAAGGANNETIRLLMGENKQLKLAAEKDKSEKKSLVVKHERQDGDDER
jgi:hypothetical protein